MKKITLLFSFVMIMIITLNFTSCKKEPAPIIRDFSAKFSGECNGVAIEGEAVFNKNKMVSITVTSPDAMKGYIYYYKSNNLTIKYGNMKVKAEVNYLPKTALPSIVYNVFTSLSKENNCYLFQEDELYAYYKGSCDSGNYIIKTQYSMGTICEIKIENIGFSVKFKAHKITS